MNKVGIFLTAIAGFLLLVTVAVAILSTIGGNRFRRLYQGEKEILLQRGGSTLATPIDAAAVAGLPPPVRKYLEVSGALGKSSVRTVVLKQRGTIRPTADKPEMPFEAEQTFSLNPPGFTWLARARVAPLIYMWARDKFMDGRGNMLIRLLGIFTVADAAGPAIDQGAGLRFLGEILSIPSAVLSPYLKWEAVDERHARVSMGQSGARIEGVAEFNAAGELTGFHADRYRDVSGDSVLTPWSGVMSSWRPIDGYFFPAHWEAVWHLKEGDLTYVRIEVLSVTAE